MTMTLKALAAGLIAATSLTTSVAASGDRTPYQIVSNCLSQITVTYQGTVYRMRENVHFQAMPVSANPDAVYVPVVSLRAGIRQHPAWQPKIADIEACLRRVPNTAYVGRRN